MSNGWSTTPRRLAAVALVTTVLASCGTPVIVPGADISAYSVNDASAQLAGKQTPVIVFGSPFSGVDSKTLAPTVAQSMVHSVPMIDTRFVPQPDTPSRPDNSVVMAFNPVGDFNPSDLCDSRYTVQTNPSERPIKLEAAFCGSGSLTTSTGWLSDAQGPQDPQFQNLVFGVTHTLFPASSGGSGD